MRKGVFYFLDLPVYRLPEDRYCAERNTSIDAVMTKNPLPETPPNPSMADHLCPADEAMRSHMFDAYGGSWRYNEVIGQVRLYLLGSQLRGEYWRVNRKRIVRTRRKTLKFWDWKLAPETELPSTGTNSEIYESILHQVEGCRRELKPRFLDSSQLTTIGPYIDWRALFEWP